MENFDWKQYLKNYQDLTDAHINTCQLAVRHWTKYGKNENDTCASHFLLAK